MKVFKSISSTAILITLLFCACKTSPADRTVSHSDQNDIVLSVLAYMITDTNRSVELVYFIDLPTEGIQRLKQRCGDHYAIFPIEMAESTEWRIHPESDITAMIVHLKNSNKEGTILRVKIGKVHRNQAEAFGSFVEGAVMNRYILKLRHGVWRVVSVENVRGS